MELRNFLKIIRKNIIVFLAIMIIAIVATLFWTLRQPDSYLASTTITVNKVSSLKQSQANYYLYDNYYNIQSSGLFAKVVTTWFESPALVKEIYQKAGIDLPNVSQRSLSRIFKAGLDEPSTIRLSISGTNKNEIEKLLNSATDVIQAKSNELNKNEESIYEIAKFTPIVSENKPNLALNLIIALIVGILLGAILSFSIEYFKTNKT